MIVEFAIQLIGPGLYAATAMMLDEPPVHLGVFDDFDDAELACHRFELQYDHERTLH